MNPSAGKSGSPNHNIPQPYIRRRHLLLLLSLAVAILSLLPILRSLQLYPSSLRQHLSALVPGTTSPFLTRLSSSFLGSHLQSAAMSTYARERRIAELAVQRAALLTDRIYKSQVKGTTMKVDKSPVTLADLGGQALVIAAISYAFPGDPVVGEEDSEVLRKDDAKRELLWQHMSTILEEGGKRFTDDLGTVRNAEEMMDWIDRGNYGGGSTGRFWTVDPIDGTLGFLKGGQYAVGLALIVDGKSQVAAISCPHLPVSASQPDGPQGILFSAEIGQGAIQKPSDPTLAATAPPQPLAMHKITSTENASFVESLEAKHSSHEMQAKIGRLLGITKPSVRMDSMTKYCVLARGDADIYLRLPRDKKYQEKIWDHAAGSLLVEEAGGVVTDGYGRPLNFGLGRTLGKDNRGLVVAAKDIHPQVVAIVKKELVAANL